MINITTNFNKTATHSEQTTIPFLVQLLGVKDKTIAQSNKLNLCLAIDVSSSMGEPIKRDQPRTNHSLYAILNQQQPLRLDQLGPFIAQGPNATPVVFEPYNPNTPNWPNQYPYDKTPLPGTDKKTINDYAAIVQQPQNCKIDLAKKAAIAAVEQLKEGDYISIVTFESSSKTIVPSTEVTEFNKKQIISQIQQINSYGGTDLHSGWVQSATEVAKKMSKNFINRVIVLSDGQTLQGITDPKRICQDVAALCEKSITTSTFGIGDGFNEDLLQAMATSGNGNFYFIEKENEFSQMFQEEFSGLSNICAKNVKIRFTLEKDVTVQSVNDYEQKDNVFSLASVTHHKTLYSLFNFNVKLGKEKILKLGTIELTYEDTQGVEHNASIKLKLPVVSKTSWEAMPENEEIKVQQTLQIIAKNQQVATQLIDRGDIMGAQNMLKQSSVYINSCGLNDERLMAQSASLDASLEKSQDSNLFRKDLTYNSYKTRNSK